MRAVRFGVFLPVGNGGWMISTTIPPSPGTYEYNRDVTLLAEDLGLDFVLSMAKWRGYGGPSRHWDHTLESMTTMSGLAQATRRIRLWATVHTMVWHPAVVAKMVATMDQISGGGRIGLNIVGGSNPYDQGQMGLWQDLDHAARYELAEEWLDVLRKLWTQERTDHDGTWFHLEDCVSGPKPAAMPTIVCAGASDTGLRFAIRNCDVSFIGGLGHDALMAAGRRIRALCAELQTDVATNALLTVVPGESDAAARARVELYDSGVDMEAIARQAFEYEGDVKQNTRREYNLKLLEEPRAVGVSAVVGEPRTIAETIATLVHGGEIDMVTLIFADFVEDLRVFGEQVLPLLPEYGVQPVAAGIPA